VFALYAERSKALLDDRQDSLERQALAMATEGLLAQSRAKAVKKKFLDLLFTIAIFEELACLPSNESLLFDALALPKSSNTFVLILAASELDCPPVFRVLAAPKRLGSGCNVSCVCGLSLQARPLAIFYFVVVFVSMISGRHLQFLLPYPGVFLVSLLNQLTWQPPPLITLPPYDF
jgi:hypothetical protein